MIVGGITMKAKEDKYPMDCYFEYEGNTIGVRAQLNDNPFRNVHGVEKISGYFNYFDSAENHLGAIAFYENSEDVLPVSADIAMRHFIELQKIK